jgi:hypothetical protein
VGSGESKQRTLSPGTSSKPASKSHPTSISTLQPLDSSVQGARCASKSHHESCGPPPLSTSFALGTPLAQISASPPRGFALKRHALSGTVTETRAPAGSSAPALSVRVCDDSSHFPAGKLAEGVQWRDPCHEPRGGGWSTQLLMFHFQFTMLTWMNQGQQLVNSRIMVRSASMHVEEEHGRYIMRCCVRNEFTTRLPFMGVSMHTANTRLTFMGVSMHTANTRLPFMGVSMHTANTRLPFMGVSMHTANTRLSSSL